MDEESSTQRFRVLMAGISEGETRILYNIENGRTDRLVRLDIASGTLTLLPAGTELLSKLDKAA